MRAIEIVDLALDCFDGPVYVRREIVHNRHVVRDFEARGVRFVQELGEVPDGATAVFSAHGVSPQVRADAAERGLRVIDATCPLVTKVHLEAIRFARMGYEILLVGHAGHEEVEGTMGEAASQIRLVSSVEDAESSGSPRSLRGVAFITQTTLSMEDTRPIVETLPPPLSEDPRAPAKDDICYATQNRQVAVRALAAQARVILVVGSRNSSNSNRLVEEARLAGAHAHLIDDVSEIEPAWLAGVETVGITSGASAPEFLVGEIVRRLGGGETVEVEEVAHRARRTCTFPCRPRSRGGRLRLGSVAQPSNPLLSMTSTLAAGRQGRLRHRGLPGDRRGHRAALRDRGRAASCSRRATGGLREDRRRVCGRRAKRRSRCPATSTTAARSPGDRGGGRALGPPRRPGQQRRGRAVRRLSTTRTTRGGTRSSRPT